MDCKDRPEHRDKEVVVIEGQSNLDFIEDACHKFGVSKYLIVLIDCDWVTMKDRLLHGRRQSEPVNQDMRNWAAFLREQARRKNLPVIDTSRLTPEQALRILQEQIRSTFGTDEKPRERS